MWGCTDARARVTRCRAPASRASARARSASQPGGRHDRAGTSPYAATKFRPMGAGSNPHGALYWPYDSRIHNREEEVAQETVRCRTYGPPLSRWLGTPEQAVIASGRRLVTAACLGLVRRIVPSLRAGATRELRQPACPGGTRPHPYVDEMTRGELLSELVAEHNATVAAGARHLSEGDLRMLLKFLRARAWTAEHGRQRTRRRDSRGDGVTEGAQPSASE